MTSQQIKRDLLHFLHYDEAPLKVLVLESAHYLPRLRELLPKAEIHAVTSDADEAMLPAYYHLGVKWQLADYHHQQLSFPQHFFDLVLADRFLEAAAEPGDLTGGLAYFIKDTGALLTSFKNIRYHRILRELMAGDFRAFIMEKPLAKPAAVRLLDVMLYKEVIFTPGQRDADLTEGKELEKLGFDNYQEDLSTEIWLVKAGRSTAETEALKSLYNPEIRRRLAFLLRRIEYDVERQAALAELQRLRDEAGIFPEYLEDFIVQTSVHREDLLKMIKE